MKRIIGLVACACASFASLWALKALPYSSIEFESIATAHEPPAKTGSFDLGTLHWEASTYTRSPALEPLRVFFRQTCGAKAGTDAVLCVSNAFADAFAHGDPKHETFEAHYDPVADLRDHMAHEPGHCVTRSSLLSAILLSVGVPARMVQLVTPTGNGHNLIEVFDSASRTWVLFDPSVGGFLHVQGKAATADVVTLQPESVRVGDHGRAPEHGIVKDRAYSELLVPGVLALYPEPWLYTRVGERLATRPFRARFVRLGEPTWQHGPTQTALRAVAVGFGLLGAWFVWSLLASRLRRVRFPAPAWAIRPSDLRASESTR